MKNRSKVPLVHLFGAMHRIAITALTAVIVFSMAACPADVNNGDGNGNGNGNPGTVTFTRSTGDGYDTWEYMYNMPSSVTGGKITTGDTYTLTYSLTSNVAINGLWLVLVDNSVTAGPQQWANISEFVYINDIAANTAKTGTLTITATGTASATTATANRMQMGVTVSDQPNQPTITFTTFSFTKNSGSGPGGGNGSTLNGTWVQAVNQSVAKLQMNNGSFEETVDNLPYIKGTYTASNGVFTMQITHIGGSISFGDESQWNSKADSITEYGNSSQTESVFAERTGSYSLTGNTLTFSGLQDTGFGGTYTRSTGGEYWSITWNLNGGVAGTGAYPTLIAKGTVLAKPSPDPTKDGNTFGGWYANTNLTQEYNFANTVTAPLSLYAKWTTSGGGSDNLPTGTPVPGETLAAKLQWLTSNAENNGAYLVEVTTAYEDIGARTLTYTSRNTIAVRLRGNGTSARVVEGSFTVPDGVTLIVDNNITLDGSTGSVVTVNSGGKLIVNIGAKITGGSGNRTGNNGPAYGGGVYVNEGGTFTMYGGEISGNIISTSTNIFGGGVYNDGTFIMNGGKISGNTITANSVPNYGAGVCMWGSNSTFTMNGGEISGNTAAITNGDGLDNANGGGVYVGEGTFTMNNGKISDNTCSADTTAPGRYGGGVYVFGTFTMKGGEISGNTTGTTGNNNSRCGGGVYVRGTFTIDGGTISGNTASYGSAVYRNTAYSSVFNRNGGTISGSVYP